MGLTTNPKGNQENKDKVTKLEEEKIVQFIEKGGSVADKNVPLNVKDDPKTYQLRLKPSLVKKIDSSLKTRQVKTPRHSWFLEAIYEKLGREKETV